MTVISDYLHRPLYGDNLAAILKKAKSFLRENKVKFDTIAVRGVSGLLVGPALAAAMGKDIIVVRKSVGMDHCHSGKIAEGNLDTERYLIVDDIISSGNTVKAIRNAVLLEQQRLDIKSGECAGVLCYGCSMGGYAYHADAIGTTIYSLDASGGVETKSVRFETEVFMQTEVVREKVKECTELINSFDCMLEGLDGKKEKPSNDVGPVTFTLADEMFSGRLKEASIVEWIN